MSLNNYHTTTTPPAPLPFRITLADGSPRTDAAVQLAEGHLTPEDIAGAGYTVSPEQPAAGPYEVVSWVDGAWVTTDLPQPTADDVDGERQRRLGFGAGFNVAGVSEPIPLQGRAFDQTVYLALLMRAQGFKAAGITAPVLTIRAADDVIHELTPDQMMSLIMQSMTWFESVMAVSWAMKDGTGDFPNGIPYDFTDDKYWP